MLSTVAVALHYAAKRRQQRRKIQAAKNATDNTYGDDTSRRKLPMLTNLSSWLIFRRLFAQEFARRATPKKSAGPDYSMFEIVTETCSLGTWEDSTKETSDSMAVEYRCPNPTLPLLPLSRISHQTRRTQRKPVTRKICPWTSEQSRRSEKKQL